MPKIPNWSLNESRTVSEVRERGLLAATVREWSHDETGDSVAIDYRDGESSTDGEAFYAIAVDGDVDEARSTLTAAMRVAREYLRTFPDGFDAGPRDE